MKYCKKYIDALPQELKNSLYEISGTGLNDLKYDGKTIIE